MLPSLNKGYFLFIIIIIILMHRVKLFFFALRSLLTSHDIPPSGKIFSQARRYPLFALLLREVDLFLLISYKSYLEK